MKPVFLDTSGLIAVVNTDDQWHAPAEAVWRRLMASRTPLITTALVLIELGDGLSRIHQRQMAIAMYDRLSASSRVEIIQTTANDKLRGWELYRSRRDKEWGVTDCVSFVVREDRNITDGFSTDRHFEQAGFSILLKP